MMLDSQLNWNPLRGLVPDGIDDNTAVSQTSTFGSDQWDFTDPMNERLRAYRRSSLVIPWSSEDLPGSVTLVLRVYALLCLLAPGALRWRGPTISSHPATVVGYARNALRFFGELMRLSDAGEIEPIQSLLDVGPKQLRATLHSFGGRQSDTRRILISLASPVLASAFNGKTVGWTVEDIYTLDFQSSEKRDDYMRVYPDEMFRHLSNCATADVVHFLREMGEVPASASHAPPADQLAMSGTDMRTLFDGYVTIRKSRAATKGNYPKEPSRYGDGAGAALSVFREAGVSAGEFLRYLTRVNHAACTLVALYTGARYSDLMGFKRGCLQQLRGGWYLVGTHIKHEDQQKPLENDLWPAIPVLRDAVACFTLLQEVSGNPYLIASLQRLSIEKCRPYSINGLTSALENYFRNIDTKGSWAHVVLSPHRYRHTLARQLARADVGLVHIAHQLKHLHTALNAVPSDVTLAYGGIADLKVERAYHAADHRLELAEALYDPDSPIAGGGADEFHERRKHYFEGMMAAGMEKYEIIAELARKGTGLASVGMGYCSGRRDIRMKDGSTEKPPCMGSLQCTPESCHNAVITYHQAPVWIKVRDQNAELAARADMSHASQELTRKSDVAKQVLSALGVAW